MRRRPEGTGCLFRTSKSPFWWIKYYVGKRPCFESTKTTQKRLAEKILGQRLAEVKTGKFFGPEWERTLVDDLISDMEGEYFLKGRKSLGDLQRRWSKHLRPYFGGMRASEVTTARIQSYIERRLGAGTQPGTVNRELAVLRRMFNIALQGTPPKINPYRVPKVPMLKEGEPRVGFVERKQFEKLVRLYPNLWWKTLLTLAYTYGWRKSELLGLKVGQINLARRTMRLDPGTTKNRRGRIVTLTRGAFALVKKCAEGKHEEEFLLTRTDGQPVRDFREKWKVACHKLGLGVYRLYKENGKRVRTYTGLVFHDLRRSAVRNLVRAGVPEVVAMRITGHKTRSVFDTYNIVSEVDIREAARKLEGVRG